VIDWTQVLTNVGVSTAAIAAVAWLLKAIVTQQLAKDIEHVKHELKIEEQIASIRFSKLHERRAEVIHEIYKRVIRIRSACAHVIDRENTDAKEDEFNVVAGIFEEVVKTHIYFGENALYLPEPVRDKYRALFTSGIIEPLKAVATTECLDTTVKRLRPEWYDQIKSGMLPLLKKSRDEMDRYISELEREFQKLLGD
jgi:hypothetical protein